ncbi:hypothetical protein NNX39_12180 [Arthrobacter sp. zg-Y826]|uniref:hypothetical protein n=1 Tax=Arthrobacter jinronghuae TaxID=2964609 RepID=UPI002102DB96|nr:hypothetical protein [Arthrobacter jinronghuae]MCQ1957257.1 hypothetical protein [Arthrobacter jinronghuae]
MRTVYVLAATVVVGLLIFGAWTAVPHATGQSADPRDASGSTPVAEKPPATGGPAEAVTGTDNEGPGTDGGATPVPEGTSSPALWELPESAREALLGFIETASAMRVEPNENERGTPPDYSRIADGSALGELTGQFEEFQDNGWIQSGPAEVLSVQAVEDLEAEGGPIRRLSICIDSSAMELKDQDGQVLLGATEPGSRKSLNYYDLQERDGTWKVVSHSFPDDPAC